MSQLELATRAEISQRHLSYIESGKSIPSREMVLRLARHLSLAQGDRNALLLAAGYAPIRKIEDWSAPEHAPTRALVERLLVGFLPYPALAIDERWTLVQANRAAMTLIGGVERALLEPPVNVLKLSLAPGGLAARILNYPQWREHVLARLEGQLMRGGDAFIRELIDEIRAYPAPSARATLPPNPVAIPMELVHRGHPLRLMSTTTVFGAPVDEVLRGIAVEAFLPADDATAHRLARLFGEAPPASVRGEAELRDLELPLAGVVDGLAEDTGGLLGGVESHAVLGGDEIEPPLRAPLQGEGGRELVARVAGLLRRVDRVDQRLDRPAAALEQLVVAVLNDGHPRLHLLLAGPMT